MDKYKKIKDLGDGTFGSVIQAQNKQTGELVAIKTMKEKYKNWEECLKLRELKALQKLKNHINIIKLKELLQIDEDLNFVFEYVPTNIWDFYNEQKKTGSLLSHDQIKSISYQLCSSMKYMHQHGFFHRDLKPENILISKSGVVKVIDFGLAREIRSRPPYTDYVATRWYRAPELLLRSTVYNSPVDIFAIGCIMAELFLGKPLFQGNSEMEQLSKISGILGTPTKEDWNEGIILAAKKGFKLQSFDSVPLEEVLSSAPYDAIQLIGECIRWDPAKRPNIAKILQHPYFQGIEKVLPEEVLNFQSGKGNIQKAQTQVPQQQQQQMKFQQQTQQQQQQQQKVEKKNSFNLDDIEDILNNVDSGIKKDELNMNTKEQPQRFQTFQQNTQSKPSLGNNVYDFSNTQQQSYTPSNNDSNVYNFGMNNGSKMFEAPSYNQQKFDYSKERNARDRPNSLQNFNGLSFNQQQTQQQQQVPHSYSPEKRVKHQYNNSQGINLKDEHDDILNSLMNDNNRDLYKF